jgi:hypothetical protein
MYKANVQGEMYSDRKQEKEVKEGKSPGRGRLTSFSRKAGRHQAAPR